MKLKDPNLSPPGSFRYTQPESNHLMVGITLGTLLQLVSQHRQNMGYQTHGNLRAEIEDAICQSLSPEDQVAHCDIGVASSSVHWSTVLRFLKTAASWAIGGFQLVPQEEAERRATICATCPLNVALSGCAVCRTTLDEARELLLKRSTSRDAELRACGICGCDNKAQVHFPLEALKQGTGDLSYPSWCWKAAY